MPSDGEVDPPPPPPPDGGGPATADVPSDARAAPDLRHTASDAAMRALRAVLGGPSSSGGDAGRSAGSGSAGSGSAGSGSGDNAQTNQTAVASAGTRIPANGSSTGKPTSTSASASASASAGGGGAAGSLRGDGGRPRIAESALNLTLVDPDRYGWTAAGGIADLATPHQVRLRRVALRRVALGCSVLPVLLPRIVHVSCYVPPCIAYRAGFDSH